VIRTRRYRWTDFRLEGRRRSTGIDIVGDERPVPNVPDSETDLTGHESSISNKGPLKSQSLGRLRLHQSRQSCKSRLVRGHHNRAVVFASTLACRPAPMRIPTDGPGEEQSQEDRARALASALAAGLGAPAAASAPATGTAEAARPKISMASRARGPGTRTGRPFSLARAHADFRQRLEQLQLAKEKDSEAPQEPDQQQQQQRTQPAGAVKVRPSTLLAVMEAELRLFDAALRRHRGLQIVSVGADGNCFFRAVSLQVYGDEEMHDVVRGQILDHISSNAEHYSQYINEDKESFEEYVRRKRQNKVFGDNLEIQAAGELYNRPVQIFTFDTRLIAPVSGPEDEVAARGTDLTPAEMCAGLRMVNLFHTEYDDDARTDQQGEQGEVMPPIRLSYHYGNHYNAVIDPEAPTAGIGLGLPNMAPNEKASVAAAVAESVDDEVASGVKTESDIAATQDDIEAAILEASRREFDRQQDAQLAELDPEFAGAGSSFAGAANDDTAEDTEAQMLAAVLAESERQYLHDMSSQNQ
jgi:OTU-like cysteine protease